MLNEKLRSGARAAFVNTVGRMPDGSAIFDKAACWIRFSKWCLSKGFSVARFDANPGFHDERYKLYEAVIRKESIDEQGICFLEFGVCEGKSILWWADRCKRRENRFIGFDTFTGLPERWAGAPQGKFSTHGRTPETRDLRCQFEVGLFQDSLPRFLKDFSCGTGRLILHLDADLYSSTLFVLTSLAGHMKPGDLIFFDEFCSTMHEFRAFDDFVRAFRFEYGVVGAVNNFEQVCLKVGQEQVSRPSTPCALSAHA